MAAWSARPNIFERRELANSPAPGRGRGVGEHHGPLGEAQPPPPPGGGGRGVVGHQTPKGKGG